MKLKEELNSIYLIYCKSNESYIILFYIIEKLSTNPFWSHIAYTLKQDIIIGLDKLFRQQEEVKSNSQKFNLHDFINRFRKDGGEFRKKGLQQQRLDEIKQELQSLKPFTSNISSLRDKLYAHTDRHVKDKIDHLDFRDTRFDKAFQLVASIITERGLLQNSQYRLEATFDPSSYTLHKIIEEAKKVTIDNFVKETNEIKKALKSN